MKKLILTLCAAGMGLYAGAQQMDQAAAMKAWEEYKTPGDVHKMIAKSDGKWTHETSMWMDPSAPPTKSKGTCTNKMIMGGRYQQSNLTGTMLGQPFEGMSLMGYDNKTHIFTSAWVDNMGTGLMTMEGKWDDATKSITFNGKCVEPMSGESMAVREVFTMQDDNHQTMEMYQTMGGQEMKVMEVKFTRATAKK